MYKVESDLPTTLHTRRRDAFAQARKVARTHGWSTWQDAFGIEPSIHYRNVNGKVIVCHCTAEQRLLRAIFDEAHPTNC